VCSKFPPPIVSPLHSTRSQSSSVCVHARHQSRRTSSHLRVENSLKKMLRRTAPHCTILHGTARHCTVLHRTATHCAALQQTAPHCTARTAPYCTPLHCNTLLQAATLFQLRCTSAHLRVMNSPKERGGAVTVAVESPPSAPWSGFSVLVCVCLCVCVRMIVGVYVCVVTVSYFKSIEMQR